jgi:DNA-binding NarL/FixJ family response regulator
MPSAGGGPGWLLAVLQFEAGKVDEAVELMREVAGPDMENWFPVERCWNWENMVLAEVARGRMQEAEECARRGDEQAGALDLGLPTAMARRARAALHLANGEAARAVQAAEESVLAATEVGALLEAAYSRSLLGRALTDAQGERSRAVAALKQAEHDLDTYGSERMRNEARRELRKLGARVEVRGPASSAEAGLDALSKRELEIAELITDRLTNPQIAEKLFLSKKTVESHVRNLFVKLGVSSRVEVARTVESSRRELDPAL